MERDLRELEGLSAQTEARIQAIPKVGVPTRCLLLVNEPDKVEEALRWLRSHHINLGSVLLIQKFQELETPVVLKPAEDVIVPPFLATTINTLSAADIPSYVIYAMPPLELTTTTVSLLHTNIDIVLIVGCHCLSRKEYEDVKDFKPLIEEIILKEAIQPVILFK